TVVLGTVGTAFALVLFGLARDPSMALGAAVLAGGCWTIVLANLYVSAQIAAREGLPVALFIAAAGALLAIPLTKQWKLQSAEGIDLTPSMHWRAPFL